MATPDDSTHSDRAVRLDISLQSGSREGNDLLKWALPDLEELSVGWRTGKRTSLVVDPDKVTGAPPADWFASVVGLPTWNDALHFAFNVLPHRLASMAERLGVPEGTWGVDVRPTDGLDEVRASDPVIGLMSITMPVERAAAVFGNHEAAFEKVDGRAVLRYPLRGLPHPRLPYSIEDDPARPADDDDPTRTATIRLSAGSGHPVTMGLRFSLPKDSTAFAADARLQLLKFAQDLRLGVRLARRNGAAVYEIDSWPEALEVAYEVAPKVFGLLATQMGLDEGSWAARLSLGGEDADLPSTVKPPLQRGMIEIALPLETATGLGVDPGLYDQEGDLAIVRVPTGTEDGGAVPLLRGGTEEQYRTRLLTRREEDVLRITYGKGNTDIEARLRGLKITPERAKQIGAVGLAKLKTLTDGERRRLLTDLGIDAEAIKDGEAENASKVLASIVASAHVAPEDVALLGRAISRAYEAAGSPPLRMEDGGTGTFERAKVPA